MWRRVEIKNYRSVEHAKVDLAPFTVLVGPNGSGKSSFVDALVFVRDAATDAAGAVERRGGIGSLRRWSPGKPADVTIDVRAGQARSMTLGSVRHRLTLRSKGEDGWTFRRENIERTARGTTLASIVREGSKVELATPELARAGGVRRNGWPALREHASAMVLARQLAAFDDTPLDNVRRLRLSPEVMRHPQPAFDRTSLDESGQGIATAYRSLPAEAKGSVVLSMSKLIPGLTDIRVEPLDRFLLLKFEQEQAGGAQALFSADAMSDGALRAFGILVAAEQMTRDELLIIEEPEVAIHPGAAHLLFDVLKESSRRGAVVLTTHSPDLLDAARDEEILVCSYRDGTTRIGPLASEQRRVVEEGLFSVAELMRSVTLRIEGELPEAAGA
jgi:type I restriction enzyme M protein